MADVFTAFDVVYGLLAAGALAMVAFAHRELRAARILIILTGALMSARWIMWSFTTDQPWPVRALVGAVVGSLILGGLPALYSWARERGQQTSKIDPKPEIPAPLYAAQLEQLREIDAFIGNKDEIELRQTFDLPDMIKFNILMAKGQLFTWGLTEEEAKKLNEFFAGGKAQIDVRFAKLTNVNNAAQYERIPGKFGLINLSKKYVENLKRLNEFVASATIPDDVKKALTDFRDAVTTDTTLIFDVINDCFQANPAQLLQNEAYGQPFYGSVTGAYAIRFLPLRPKADLVSAAMRKYLRVQ